MFYFVKVISLMERVIGQSASIYKHQMKRRRCCLHMAFFRKLISSVNVLTLKEKIEKFLFRKK